MSSCDNCKVCVREGLMILPVRPSLVDAKRHGKHVPRLDAFGGPLSKHQWEGAKATVRTLRGGFLHVYYEESQIWDFYEVTQDGFTSRRPYPELSSLSAPSESYGCSRGGANVAASVIGIRNALQATKVWIAFSSHLWSRATLSHYKACKPAERELRMTCVNPADWITSGNLPKGALALNADNLKYVTEFADGGAAQLREVFSEATHPLYEGRIGLAKSFSDSVRKLEASHPSGKLNNKTLILLLDDPIGVGESANHLRLMAERAQELWSAGQNKVDGTGADPDRPWKRQSQLAVFMIDEWVKQSKHRPQKERLEAGVLMGSGIYITHARGNRMYRPGTRWVGDPMRDAKGQPIKLKVGEKQSRIAFDHVGNELAMNDGIKRSPHAGRVFRDETEINRIVEQSNKGDIASRVKRYRGHLNQDALNAFIKEYESDEKNWHAHRKNLDTDLVNWVESARTEQALSQDYERKGSKLSALKGDAQALRDRARDAAARLAATDQLFGAGPQGPASLKYYADMLALPINAEKNWLARGLLDSFDLTKEIKQSDPMSQLYDASAASASFIKEGIPEVRALIAEQTAQRTQNLLNAQANTLSRLAALIYDPKQAQALGINMSAAQLDDLRIVWVKAEALLNHVHGGDRTYVVRLKRPAKAVLKAFEEYGDVVGTDYLFTLKSSTANESTKTAATTSKVEQRLDALRRSSAFADGRELVVPVLLDETAWKQAQSTPGKQVSLIADSVFDAPKAYVSLPESMADKLLVQRPAKGWKSTLLGGENKLTKGLLGGTAIMQTWVLYDSVEQILKGCGSGAELVDASMNVLGGLASGANIALELTAMAKEPRALAKGATPGNTLLRQVISPLRLRMAAGVAGSAGAVFDAVTSHVKSRSAILRGDKDSGQAYKLAERAYWGSAAASGLGSYITYRALAARATQQATVQLARGIALRAGAAALLGASLTGVGIVLAIAGLAYTLYAIYMEDDDNEIFLDRSYFGVKARKAQNPPFENLDDETKAFTALALGVKATLEWEDKVGEDEVRAKLLVANWTPQHRVRYKLRAQADSKAAGGDIIVAEGVAPGKGATLTAQKDVGPEAMELEIKVSISNEEKYPQAIFEFELWDSADSMTANLPAQAKDRIVVRDEW